MAKKNIEKENNLDDRNNFIFELESFYEEEAKAESENNDDTDKSSSEDILNKSAPALSGLFNSNSPSHKNKEIDNIPTIYGFEISTISFSDSNLTEGKKLLTLTLPGFDYQNNEDEKDMMGESDN